MNYIEIIITANSFNEELSDILISSLDEIGFESYEFKVDKLYAYITEHKYSERNLKVILSSIILDSNTRFGYQSNFIQEQNWNSVWESNFSPIIIANKCTIKASFHKNLKKTRYNITINPKMAFGTGHHATTSLMVKNLLEIDLVDKKILDLGCGTGILAILCAKKRAKSPIHAVDIDPIAIDSTLENIRINRVQKYIFTTIGDASVIQKECYNLILANITRNFIIEDMAILSGGLKEGGELFLSGFREEDVDLVVQEGIKYSMEVERINFEEGWAFVKLKKSITFAFPKAGMA